MATMVLNRKDEKRSIPRQAPIAKALMQAILEGR